MTKLIKMILFIFVILLIFPSQLYAMDQEMLKSQYESLNIPKFIEEAQKYTENFIGDININELFDSALKGNIDNSNILKKIFNIFGKELKNSINTIRNYFNYNNYSCYIKEYKRKS